MRSFPSTRRRGGFTLVELLVVIGIIALLISILLPSLNNARKSALKIKCQANLHNIGNALMIYASSNRGRLPAAKLQANPFSGDNWLWDIEIPTRDMMVKAGATRATFYCPSAPENLKDLDFVWTYPGAAPNGTWSNSSMEAWLRAKSENDRQNGIGILGYVCMILRPDGPGMNRTTYPGINYDPAAGATLQTGGNPGDVRWVRNGGRTWKYQKSIVPDNKGCEVPIGPGQNQTKSNSASETEIFADVVGYNQDTRDFSILRGGLTDAFYQGTNHLGRNKTPLGANVLFLDGHVAWREFSRGSHFNPKLDSGFPNSRPADFFSQDTVHWRADGVPAGTGAGAAPHWFF